MKNGKKYFIFIKNIILLIIILIYIYIYLNDKKICLCTVGKLENRYIREFVEFYIKFGVDKIYLYDNNEISGEKFEDVISDYINNKYVHLVNRRGDRGNLIKIMDDCYQKNHNNYDWLIFYEIDEFLYLKNFNNIKKYLYQHKFDRCDAIQLNWVHRSDNNMIYYMNKPVQERFTEKGVNVVKNKENPLCFFKTIIRGHLKNINIVDNHFLNKKIKACNGFGKNSKTKGIISIEPDYDYYYINHYFGKSTEEFVNKIKRGDILRGNNSDINNFQIYKYFVINELTVEKLEYLEKHLGSRFNLSKYWQKLKCK